jgi:hydrogenase maturation factor
VCLSVPAQIVELKGAMARVRYPGQAKGEGEVGRMLIPGARPGDWALVYAGQIVSLVPPAEVEPLLAIFEEVMAAA